jgi:hypothetical protein
LVDVGYGRRFAEESVWLLRGLGNRSEDRNVVMANIELGVLSQALGHPRAECPDADHHTRQTELVLSVVLAAWAIVLLCGCIVAAGH